jgi:hypothetical protein
MRKDRATNTSDSTKVVENGVSEATASSLTTPPCYACGGTRHWKSIYGAVVCGGCHPPVNPDLVAEWLDAPDRQSEGLR